MADEVGNLVAILPATTQEVEPPLILLGHADTVPGEIAVRVEGNRLYGRGAVDAKGPLAAFLCATTRLAATPGPRGRDVVVVGATEEEVASSRGARHILPQYQPGYVVIGEPSGATGITLGYKGRLLAHCRVERAMSHTARPDESAGARTFALWQSVRDAAEAWNATNVSLRAPAPYFATLQPSLRWIRSASDGLREWCEMELGFRLPPGYDPATLETQLANLAERHNHIIHCRGAEIAIQGPRTGPLPSAFVRAIRAGGEMPVFKLKTGTSDMNVVGAVWRCPIIAYGPGDAALDHTPDEHIELDEFQCGIAVLERVLSDLTAPEGAQL
jgi:N-acetyl-ornithine/N-acetyl-lysine deacetylase